MCAFTEHNAAMARFFLIGLRPTPSGGAARRKSQAKRAIGLMRILVFSTLYPNAAMPAHGVFVENRLRAFLKNHDAEIKVVAPVPWFPFQNDTFGAYAAWARAPEREMRHGIDVWHPHYFVPPKIGMNYAPHSLAQALRRTITELAAEGRECDLIDAHYFFPDGVAAAKVANELGKPLVITARGTDINLIPKYAAPRRAIVDAAGKADAIVTVSGALKEKLGSIGIEPDKISILRNGVDLEKFTQGDRDKARAKHGLTGQIILSVGHLIDRKGHELVIDALRNIEGATLLIVGDGPRRGALEAQVKRAGLFKRVKFLGQVPHETLSEIYSAADVLVLASSREGWPNVLLEAMACGTPCIATNIPGCDEVICDPAGGRLVDQRTPEAIAEAINALFADPPGRAETRRYAEQFSWDDTVHGMAEIFSTLTGKSRATASIKSTPVSISGGAAVPQLIVTVDTEEQFDWARNENTRYHIDDIADIDRFQQLCAGMGAAPLYFLTYPLLKNQRTIAYFRSLIEQRKAACGLHFHQWVTPPENNHSGGYFSFQKNLPLDQHFEKLNVLAKAFETAFGAPALSHRAGRYGVSPEHYAQLAALGVQYDFSPSPAFDYSSAGGPDFSGFSNKPFAVHDNNAQVFVTPVSGARAIRKTSFFLNQERNAPGFAASSLNPYYAQLTTPMRLSPEGASLGDLKALTRRLISDGAPILSFTLHSTSLTPGANPYAKDAAGVDHILERTGTYLSWFQKSMGGEIVTLDMLADIYDRLAPRRRA